MTLSQLGLFMSLIACLSAWHSYRKTRQLIIHSVERDMMLIEAAKFAEYWRAECIKLNEEIAALKHELDKGE